MKRGNWSVKVFGSPIVDANQVERLNLAVGRRSLGSVELVDMDTEDRLRARSNGSPSIG